MQCEDRLASLLTLTRNWFLFEEHGTDNILG